MRSLVIGRFQPLHVGHVKMIEYASEKSNYLVVGLGSCNKSMEWENPFTAEEREEMIKESLSLDTPYEIKRIPDFGDDREWVEWIKGNLGFEALLTNSDNERRIFEEAGLEVDSVPFYDREKYSATEVRRRMLEDEDWAELLPVGSVKVISRIDGVYRVKELAKGVSP